MKNYKLKAILLNINQTNKDQKNKKSKFIARKQDFNKTKNA